jgi:replicative DNA helicase
MLHLARAALRDKREGTVLFFSLEMALALLTRRIMASESGIALSTLSQRGISTSNQDKLYKSTAWLAEKKFIVDESSMITPFEIYAKARSVSRQHGLKAIFVDYLQIISPPGDKRLYNRDQEVAHIARSLKILAKELKVPVIVGSQMNRQHDQRGGGMDRLSDLRESDAIGNESDNVFFMQPPATPQEHPEGYLELQFAKHRNGATGTIPLVFDRIRQQFRPCGHVT